LKKPDFYHAAKQTVRVVLRLLTRWKVNGKQNLPKEGPVMIVANHIQTVDPLWLAVSVDRKVIFMAKEELFRNKILGPVVRGCGSFPVHRGGIDKEALRKAYELLSQGMVLGMFPEGSRSPNTRLQRAHTGAARIALRSGVPIVPAGISGTEKLKGKAWILRRPRLTVTIGKPFYPPSYDGKLTKEQIAELTESMMQHIAELLPPEYR